MFGVAPADVRLCSGVTRREWLRVGSLGAAGLSLPRLLHAQAAPVGQGADGFGRAKSCILCFLFGAPAHQDIWDLKPLAPAEIRGEFNPIASNVPGILLGEHIPHVAQVADRLALVRSMHHPDDTHTVAMHYMLTGQRHLEPATNPRNQPTDFPTFGAVLQYLRRDQPGLPAGISLNSPANQVSASNHIFPGFFAGCIGDRFDPLFVSQDPSSADFQALPAADADTAASLARRRSLLSQVDSRRSELEAVKSVRAFNAEYERAFSLVTSREARRAFELSEEPDAVRDRYGRSAFGQGVLLARRLVESGVPLVTVNWARDDAYWDTHANNFRDLKEKLLPPFDLAFSALIEDLDQRGLLAETLVVCLGEFGRTPRINGAAGRDHWAACNTVVLAGGGIRGGQVLGASDKNAAFPADAPVTPEDLAATIYHALGVDLATELVDVQGRPRLLPQGRVLHELF